MDTNFTIGADPEVFLRNHDNKLISAIGLIGGSKESPLDIGNGCAVQEDNVAAEFCIPACESAKEFINSIEYALSNIHNTAKEYGLTLAELTASGVFDREQLANPMAQRFGCDPDYNAYTERANPRPRARNKALRSAGGHVHIGTDKDPIKVIKAMDLFLGLPSLLQDEDTQRRELYGKAGCFRFKPYGVEYRTLSNYWIWKSETIDWVYHQVKSALDCTTYYDTHATDVVKETVRNCIDTNDKETAKKLILDWGIKTL